MPLYTHGSYSYWIVWLFFYPPLFSHFFYCVYNSYTLIRSFAALHHLNLTGISREFFIHIGTCCLDHQHISGYLSHGFMEISHITGMVKQGYRFQWCLSLHVSDCTCMLGIMINIWLLKFHGVYKLYTHVFPSLSKYGVYNISPLIVLCTYSQLCAMHLFLLAFAASYCT